MSTPSSSKQKKKSKKQDRGIEDRLEKLDLAPTIQKRKSAKSPKKKKESQDDLSQMVDETATEVLIDNQKPVYQQYSSKQKELFLYYLLVDKLTAAQASRLSGVSTRTGQYWARNVRSDSKWNIFAKKSENREKPVIPLKDEYREFVVYFLDENPQSCLVDVLRALAVSFENFDLKETSIRDFLISEYSMSIQNVTAGLRIRESEDKLMRRKLWAQQSIYNGMDYLSNCVFINETEFSICKYPLVEHGIKMPESQSTQESLYTLFGAISAKAVLCVDVSSKLEPEVLIKNEKKAEAPKKDTARCYIDFLNRTMDEMDRKPAMKNFHIVLDNAPSCSLSNIEKQIVDRGYICVHLPRFSPGLSPVEQFWSIVKNKVKRNPLSAQKDLATRIIGASTYISSSQLTDFVKHSCTFLDKCLNKKRF